MKGRRATNPAGGWCEATCWPGGAAEGWAQVSEMRVMAVGVESGAARPVLLLQEASGDHRLLPVWIGTAEANAIQVEQHRVSLPRPMTHQLIGDVVDALGRRVEQVRITEIRDNIFFAELILDQSTKVSARVSDAIALALHLSIPIHAEDTVLDAAAVANTAIRAEDDDNAPEEVEEFRRFLDTASPEDFDPD
jgi:bifunctional DNase/RNase